MLISLIMVIFSAVLASTGQVTRHLRVNGNAVDLEVMIFFSTAFYDFSNGSPNADICVRSATCLNMMLECFYKFSAPMRLASSVVVIYRGKHSVYTFFEC